MAKQESSIEQFDKIRKEILDGNIRPFYLLFGKEHYYIDALCELIMQNALLPEERDFGQVLMFGADTNATEVISVARQYPMMVSKQLVVVKEAQMMKKVEDIGIYFKDMMTSTVLVICYKTPNDPTKSSKNIDKRTSFYKEAQKAGVVFESNQIPDYKIPKWIEDYVASKSMKIEPAAAALLAESAGIDIQKIVLEVDKLVKVLPEGSKVISERDIEENVGMSRDYSVFELTKALSVRNVLKCYKIAHFFGESEKRFPIQLTLAAISSHFLKILRFHALLQDGTSRSEALSVLGINPYFAKEYDDALKNYNVTRTMYVISLIREYDYKSKSNARGSASDGELLCELICKILN